MKEKFLEQEKQHMIETFLKKKSLNKKQVEEYWKNKEMEEKPHSEDFIKILKSDAEEKHKHEKLNHKINEFVSIIIHSRTLVQRFPTYGTRTTSGKWKAHR